RRAGGGRARARSARSQAAEPARAGRPPTPVAENRQREQDRGQEEESDALPEGALVDVELDVVSAGADRHAHRGVVGRADADPAAVDLRAPLLRVAVRQDEPAGGPGRDRDPHPGPVTAYLNRVGPAEAR